MRVCASVVVTAVLMGAADDLPEDDRDRIQDTWVTVSFEVNGQGAPSEAVKDIRTVLKDKDYVQKKGDEVLEEGTFTLDPDKKPRQIDFKIGKGQDQGKDQFGIYELDGDTLRICVAAPGAEAEARPTVFRTGPESQTALVVMRREKP
jgi:uncharacterized protein (TIGR03067 family)